MTSREQYLRVRWCLGGTLVAIVAALTTPLAMSTTIAADVNVTFAKDVVPILQKSCQSCHNPTGLAPMSLVTYEQVRPWARAMKQRVTQREMPPWHIDRTVGIRKYKNDLSLSNDEIAIVARWVDLGAPEGNKADMPPPLKFLADDEWAIGKPDVVISMSKEHRMYANGPDWWIDYYGDNPLTEDRWVKAVEVKAGNRKIVHHAITYLIDETGAEQGPSPEGGGELLHNYTMGGELYSEGTGRLLKAGTKVRFDMHYFASGEEGTDRTSLAFVLYPKGYVPAHPVKSTAFRNEPNDLDIPPNTVAEHDGFYRVKKDMRLEAFQPHMHLRGKAMALEAIYPDNSRQVLSSATWDFKWNVKYIYADDVAPLLPAGTVLHIIGIEDNTAANKNNPDPRVWVGFGRRSVDEMLQCWVNYIEFDDHEEFARLVAERKKINATSTNQQH